MADWIGINSSHLDSYCGHGDNMPLSHALDGSGSWYHFESEKGDEHWFIIDLGENDGKFYELTKFRGRSDTVLDPTEVAIYVSETNGDWGDAVVSEISTWQDIATWVEELATAKIGRFIKVIVTNTEAAGNGEMLWGTASIFDAYGFLVVLMASLTESSSGASGLLSGTKDLISSISELSVLTGGIFVSDSYIRTEGMTSGVSNVTGILNLQPKLVGVIGETVATLGNFDLCPKLISSASGTINISGSSNIEKALISSVNVIVNTSSQLNLIIELGSTVVEVTGALASLGLLDVLTSLISSITTISSTIGNIAIHRSITGLITNISVTAGSLDVTYRLRGNSAAKKWYDMLQRKGIDATIQVYPDAIFEPATNKTSLSHVVEHSVKIIPPYKNREGYKKAELITSGNGLSGIVNYNLRFDVKAGLIVNIAEKRWTVTGITKVKDSTGIILYTLEIEAGD